MNKIKRKKEGKDTLLSYKFGICNAKKPSEKIIIFSKLNKRIILNKLVLHKYLYDYKNHKIDIVRILITEENLDMEDKVSFTPLHWALRYSLPEEIIKLLITKNNLNIGSRRGQTPLYIALAKPIKRCYSNELIYLLITDKNKNMKGFENRTPLHEALFNRYPEEVIRLLITKENVDMKYHEGCIPYEISRHVGYSEEILSLLKKK